MKRLFQLLLIFTSSCFISAAWGQKASVTFSPECIIEGSAGNTLTYNPEGTVLANETDIRCVVYFFENLVWRATDVDLVQQEGKWIGRFNVPEEAALLLCKFYAGNLSDPKTVKTDWGWPATYASFVLDKKQQNKPASNMGWGLLRSEGSPLTVPGLLEDSLAVPIRHDVTLFWLNNEFKYHPEMQPYCFNYLMWVHNNVKPGEKDEQLKENMRRFLADKKLKLPDQQYADMYDVSLRTLRDSALAADKHGIIERDERIPQISNLYTTDIPAALKQFDDFMKTYPTAKFQNVHSFITDLFYSKMFRSAIYSKIMKQNDYSNLQKYIHDIPYEELITTHWHIVEVCYNNGQLTPEKLYPHSLLIVNEMQNRPQLTNSQRLLSPREYAAEKAQKFAMAFCAHARICTALGKYDEAMKYAEMVYPTYGATNTEFASMWVKLLQENG